MYFACINEVLKKKGENCTERQCLEDCYFDAFPFYNSIR